MKLFLDCDGVLADFDAHAREIFGMEPRAYEDNFGSKRFWKTIANTEGFYENLPIMSDAMDLWNATKHLNPTILTGCPAGDWSQPQKVRWAYKHFGSDVRIITCRSRDKRLYMVPKKTNILVDDYTKYQELWEEHDGIFVHHVSTKGSLDRLKELKLI